MADFLSKVFTPLTNLINGILEAFHSLGAPWWLSIMLLTILVRGALAPLTVRQVKNMRAMQELKPALDEIRSRHKDDRQKQQEAMVELYKERRFNPLAGFLPVLVQVPVFVTMYQVVRSHEETFPSFASGGLLWFADLTRHDPYFVLPVLSASILVVAGEVSARNVDPQQKKVMRFLPVVFTAFIARFPAGLFVYWVTSNAFTLVQNLLIHHRGPGHAPSQDAREALAGGPPESPTEDPGGPAKGAIGRGKKKAKSGRKKRRKKKKKR